LKNKNRNLELSWLNFLVSIKEQTNVKEITFVLL
jgi:hypothetical protein